jgi:hypothetical protein
MHLSRIEKRKVLYDLLIERDVDICAISETRLLEGSGDRLIAEVMRKKFNWFGLDRKSQACKSGEGGVGILVNKRLGNVRVVKKSSESEVIWIEILIAGQVFFIGGVYFSPHYSKRGKSFSVACEELLSDISDFRNEAVWF